ncbi:MAG: EAL domain-containing protein [Ruminococcus sp.]|jgi:diguanylate cyclase (GGDEF)-like protein|nr:EAL domain-containing protein [Ruminococcus sp.]
MFESDNYKDKYEGILDKLRVEELFLEFASDRANIGLWRYFPETKLLSQSKKLNGRWSAHNLEIPDYRETVKDWKIIYPEDIETFDRYCDSMDSGEESFSYDLRAITDDYTYSWLRYIGRTVRNDDGSIAVVAGMTLDVTEEKNTSERVIKQAKEDALTHVYSRDYIKLFISEHMKSQDIETNHLLIIVDIDNIKQINRSFGRLYGDHVLLIAAGAITSCISAKDVVGRMGGDTFAVFCPYINDPVNNALLITEKIRMKLHTLHLKCDLSASIGASIYPRHGEDFDTLYKSADIALYHAKTSGKDRAVVFSRQQSYSDDIENIGAFERKAFGSDVITHVSEDVNKQLFDYCFDIVTRVSDFDTALDEIFNETGKYFDLDRISLTEKNTVGELTIFHNWFRVPTHDESRFTDVLAGQALHFDAIIRRFKDKGYYLYSFGDPTDEITGIPAFEAMGSRAFLQFPIYEEGEIIGTVTFEDYDQKRDWNDGIIATLSSITKMIASFALSHRNKIRLANETLYTGRALEDQHLTYYVVDPKNYEIKYISAYANVIFPKLRTGEKCYVSAMGYNRPCDFCPLKNFDSQTHSFSLERYDKERDIWFSITASELITSDNEQQVLVCFTDVTSFLERVSAVDRLTGVYSYEKFNTEATAKLHDKQGEYAVVFAGIRHFDFINDQLGYVIGDEVLKLFALCFSRALGLDEIMCRIKGDDFVFMLRLDELISIEDRLRNVLKTLESIMRQRYKQINLMTMFGIYRVKSDDYSISRSIDKANRAKKAASGVNGIENCVIIDFDRDLGEQENEAARLESMMYDAINSNQFHVYVQPKVDIKSGRIGGAEALIRWILPDGSFIPTFEFVKLFERNGFIVEIDKYVYNTLFAFIRKWLDEGKEPTLISVNVSRLHLFDDTFPDYLNALAAKYDIPHKYIEVEITESVFFDNTEKLIHIISMLRNRGFVISMDDFGTGYSTLNLMKSLPIDIVKIDSGFFLKNEMDKKSRAVISSIIHLCKNLDLKIVCEGIETPEQVEYITSEYCDYAQGFFYYKPMPIEEFEKLV